MNQITNRQIRKLEAEAFAEGDALLGYICRVALGAEYTAAQLNDESALDRGEQLQIVALSEEDARKACVLAINQART